MLKRFKAQVSQVANDLPGVLSSSRDSRDDSFANLANQDDEIEGFLCPGCMTHFPSPEQLSQHFAEAHTEDTNRSASGLENPNFESKSNGNSSTAPSFSSKDKEIEELRIQIKEEKTFAGKLKEELDRIQSVVAQATDVPDGEVPYLLQQIQVLEAGKSMVTQRMLELDKEATQLRRSLDGGNQERSEIMGKLKQLSQQIRILTDENEANKVEKEISNRELAKSRAEISEMSKEIDQLAKSLDQRPSEDDVAVLRTELIHAQKLMDEISQQKDVEITEHLHSIRQLNMEREKVHCAFENAQKQLVENGSSTKLQSEEVVSLSSELSELNRLLENSKIELIESKKESKQKDTRITDLQSRVETNVTELASCREKIQQLEDTVRQGTRDIDDSHSLNEKNQQKLQQLSEKLEQMIEEKKKYESDIYGFEEQHQKQGDAIKHLELANLDLTNELASLGSMLEQERKLIAEKNTIIQNREEESHRASTHQSESDKRIERIEKERGDAATLIDGLQRTIAELEENAKQLVGKVAEGEGGAKMAIDQITNEKKRLTDEVAALTTALKEQSTAHTSKLDELEKKSRDAERLVVEKLQKAERELEETGRRLKESDDECNRKAERFVEMEKESEEERRKTSERIGKMKEIIQQKEASSHEMRGQIEKLGNDVSDRERLVRERERQLEESRLKIEESVRRLQTAEDKARQLEADLLTAENGRTDASSAETETREKLTAAERSIEQLKKEGTEIIFQLTTAIHDKEDELAGVRRELKDKEDHWTSKREDYEKQLEKNQEANEELLSSVKDLQSKIRALEQEKDVKEAKISNYESRLEDSSTFVAELESSLENEKKNCKEALETLESVRRDNTELETSLNLLRSKNEDDERLLKSLEESVTSSRLDLEQLTGRSDQERAELESRILDMTNEKADMQIAAQQYMEEIAGLTEKTHRLQSEVTSKQVEVDLCEERIHRFEAELCEQRILIQETNTEKVRLEQSAKDTENTMESEKKTWEDQQRAFDKELSSLQKELTEKIDTAKKLEARCTQFEKLTKDIRFEKEREVAERQAHIERLQEEMAAQVERHTEEVDKMGSEKEQLKRTVQSIQSEVDAQKADNEDSKKTAEEMTMKNIELSQQISSWEEEKNALIERCLNTESDLEFERERALENKRRFDEALSAMHELGRANQSLQMDISKHTTRKWLDDSAAVNCTSCGRGFSMTVRKHHCRVCGLIFCNPCSAKTISIASNKNPVRVCGGCHAEVLSR